MKPYMVSFTQKEAGFKTEITEEILTVAMHESTHNMVKKLKKERVLQGQIEVVLADTAVKLMSKIHQLYSGTVKFESGRSGDSHYSSQFKVKSAFPHSPQNNRTAKLPAATLRFGRIPTGSP